MLRSPVPMSRRVQWLLPALLALAPVVHAGDDMDLSDPDQPQIEAPDITDGDMNSFIDSQIGSGGFDAYLGQQQSTGIDVIDNYQGRPETEISGEWRYRTRGQEFSSEGEVIQAILGSYASSPQCAATQLSELEWAPVHGGGGGHAVETARVGYVMNRYHPEMGRCVASESVAMASRSRSDSAAQ